MGRTPNDLYRIATAGSRRGGTRAFGAVNDQQIRPIPERRPNIPRPTIAYRRLGDGRMDDPD